MARCEDCLHYNICLESQYLRIIIAGNKADERCKWFKSAADAAPKSEAIIEVLSDLKKEVHDKALYAQCRDSPSYVTLREFDAIISNISNRLYEKARGEKNESKDT